MYKEDWNTLTANCDTKLFLGCDDVETIEWLLKMLGKKTTVVENTSYQVGGGGSTSYNRSSLEVLTIDQVSMMADDECLVRIRGKRPYYGKKYDLEKHPNYEFAMKLKGKYEIPLSPELKEKRDRDRGPLRFRAPAQGILNAKNEAEEPVADIVVEAAPSPAPVSQKKELNKEAENVKRKENAQKASDEYQNMPEKIQPPPELTVDAAMDMLEAFGINTESTQTQIKEAVETVIELQQPSIDVIKFGITD